MDLYKIVWKQSARKELRKLDKQVIPPILEAIDQLPAQPVPSGAKKLSATEHTYRMRAGNYRVVYNILSSVLIIEIIKVRHRKNAYRR